MESKIKGRKDLEDIIMLIGINAGFNGEDVCSSTVLKEVRVNHEASEYILNNYSYIQRAVMAKGIDEERAKDLVHDMYLNLFEAEKNGEGYDSNYGDGGISVGQFVVSRAMQYAKNVKYSKDYVDTATDKMTVREVVEVPILNKNGTYKKDRKGNIKMEKQITTKTVKSTVTVYAASDNGIDTEDGNDGFQTAYAMAASPVEDMDFIGEREIRQYIDTCIDICELHEYDIIPILKNISELASVISISKSNAVNNMLSKLTNIVKANDDLAEAITEIFKYRMDNLDEYEGIIACY